MKKALEIMDKNEPPAVIEPSIVILLCFELDFIFWPYGRFVDETWFYKLYFFKKLFNLRVLFLVSFFHLWNNFFLLWWRFSTLFNQNTRSVYLCEHFLLHSAMELLIIVFNSLVFVWLILTGDLVEIKVALNTGDVDYTARH